jgi:putative addiction module component (TIGR02574 family)
MGADLAERRLLMTSTALKHALDLALELPADERAALAQDLLASLDGSPGADAAEVWEAEIGKRFDALESGQAQTVSAQETLGRIDERLRRG